MLQQGTYILFITCVVAKEHERSWKQEILYNLDGKGSPTYGFCFGYLFLILYHTETKQEAFFLKNFYLAQIILDIQQIIDVESWDAGALSWTGHCLFECSLSLSLSLCVLCYPLHACHQQHLLSCSRIEVTLIYFGFHHLNVFNSIYYRWSSLSQLFFFFFNK